MTTTRILQSFLLFGALLIGAASCGDVGQTKPQQPAPPPAAAPAPAPAVVRDTAAVTDFYASVNREWLEQTTIPADKPAMNNFLVIRDDVTKAILTMLSDLSSKTDLSPEDRKTMTIYQAYMDMAARNAKGVTPLQPDLKRIDEIKTLSDLTAMFAALQKIGVAGPLLAAPDADFRNSDSMIVFFVQGGLGMEQEAYLRSDERSAAVRQYYREYLTELFTFAKLPSPEKAAAAAVELETRIAAIHWTSTQNRNMEAIYNIMDYPGVKARLKGMDMDRYMTVIGLPKSGRFNVMQPTYFDSLNALLKATDIASWKMYLKARLLASYAGLLDSNFTQSSVRFSVKRGLIEKDEPLETKAVNYLNGNVGFLLGKTYIENSFDKKIKTKVEEIIGHITTEYRIAMTESKRMSPETKAKALNKLAKMTFQVGYPEEWQDYGPLTVVPGELVLNHQNIARYDHQRSIDKLSKPRDRKEWGYAPQIVNAFYNPTTNSFVILAGILHPPFFDMNANDAAMFGGIGFVIGHEIGHGFDDQGSQFDEKGNMANWWTAEDAAAFGKIKKDLIAQADAYEILPGKFLKGELEIGEIIGDLSGAEIALRAYQRIVADKKLDAESGYRDFFRQLAITWRSKVRDEYAIMLLDVDVHPPAEYRGNGIAKNFDEFHAVFNTRPGDRMYLAPEKRISLWKNKE